MKIISSLFLLPLALSVGLSSCVDAGFGGGGYGAGGYNSYSALPANYNGGAYNHNGRYYSGGNYQTGSFTHQGQAYSSRYQHNGQYYYGGSHQYYGRQRGNDYRASMNMNAPGMQHSNSPNWQKRH